jgi:ABC-type polysaccharide/polyol phosphate export permease
MNRIFRVFDGIYAFFRLDAKTTSSYKLNFSFSIVSMFIRALAYGFVGEITQSAQAQYMAAYGNMDVATFVLIGFMLETYLRQSLFAPRNIASPGNLERILLTPCSIQVFVLGTMTWEYFWNTLNLIIFIFIGSTLFGMNIFLVNWWTFIIILFVGIMANWGLGIIGSAIALVVKSFSPFNRFILNLSYLVSGLFYSPAALLTVDPSGILYHIAWCLPQTYVYYMARLAFAGQSILDMLSPLLNLAIMAVIFFGVGWFAFKLCLRRCQLEGSLGWV